MEGLRESTRGGLAVGVRPWSNAGQVGRGGIVEDLLAICHGFGSEEVLRDVGDGHVAQLSPGVRIGEDSKQRDDAGGGLHGGRAWQGESEVPRTRRAEENSIMTVIWRAS